MPVTWLPDELLQLSVVSSPVTPFMKFDGFWWTFSPNEKKKEKEEIIISTWLISKPQRLFKTPKPSLEYLFETLTQVLDLNLKPYPVLEFLKECWNPNSFWSPNLKL